MSEVKVNGEQIGSILRQSATIANSQGQPVYIRRDIDGDVTPSSVEIKVDGHIFFVTSNNARGIRADNIALATRDGRPISAKAAMDIVNVSEVLSNYKYDTGEADRVTRELIGTKPGTAIAVRQ